MDRLAKPNPSWINDEFWTAAEEPDDEEIGEVYRRLMEFENTGLTPDEITRLTAENAALKAELNGKCWACAKAKPYPKSASGAMMTCEHLSARNILAANASRNCPRWQWRGEEQC